MIRSAGFTLIELLVVIAILGVLAVALLPNVFGATTAANITADGANQKRIYEWLYTTYKVKKGLSAPKGGGHKFVMSPWVYGVIERTPEHRDRFFTPGQEQDMQWSELRQLSDEEVKALWRSFDEVTSEDTHYAGRADRHYAGMWSGSEALLANDNEYGRAFGDDPTINVLMGTGSVRPLFAELQDYLDPEDDSYAIPVGPDSPMPLLQKLER